MSRFCSCVGPRVGPLCGADEAGPIAHVHLEVLGCRLAFDAAHPDMVWLDLLPRNVGEISSHISCEEVPMIMAFVDHLLADRADSYRSAGTRSLGDSGGPVKGDFGNWVADVEHIWDCLLYTSPSPRDRTRSRM